jgi:lysophospholipase L1-like esterase
MPRILRIWVSVLSLGLPLVMTGQHANQGETDAQRTILIGASYAQGWGSPSLPGIHVVNKGRSGEETAQMLARFESEVISEDPDAVIIWGHINDIFRAPNGDMATAVVQAKHNLEEMVHAAQRANIRVIVATEVTLIEPRGFLNWIMSHVGPLLGKVSYQSRVNVHVREINEFVRDLAARNSLALLDLESALLDERGERGPDFALDDGSHISPAGYSRLTAFASEQAGALAQ